MSRRRTTCPAPPHAPSGISSGNTHTRIGSRSRPSGSASSTASVTRATIVARRSSFHWPSGTEATHAAVLLRKLRDATLGVDLGAVNRPLLHAQREELQHGG